MRGRVVVPLLLILVSVGLEATAQCNYSTAYSGEFRATWLDLAVDGNDLWAATSYGVQVLDRTTDPPSPVANIALPGVTKNVRVQNGVAYAVSGTRIFALRKNGRALTVAGSVDTGATINDLVATTLDLYVGTSNGILQFDLLNPNSPTRTQAIFATSATNVTSLALSGSTLYAADGDATVEIFSITLPSAPQKTGTIPSLTRSASVRVAGSRLFISDGFSTDVFVVTGSNYTRAGTPSVATLAFAPLTDDVTFSAGSDRRIRAIDWTLSGTPVELFATDIIPTGGTVNRATAMVVSGHRLYVAAGDAGLLSYDVTAFTPPFPVRDYPMTAATAGTSVSDNATSTVWVDGKLYTGRRAVGVEEFVRSSSGTLVAGRQWDNHIDVVRDGGGGFLLTSTGNEIDFWTLVSTTPTLISSPKFASQVSAAVLSGTRAIAALDDGTIWTADLTQTSPSPQKVVGLTGSSIARSGSAVVIATILDAGSTRLSYYANGDLAASPATVTLPGVTTTAVTLGGSVAAVLTFNGISLYDFATATTTVLPGTNTELANALAVSAGRLFVAADSALSVWDLATKTVSRTLPLPYTPASLAVDGSFAGMAATNGVMLANVDSSSRPPSSLPVANANLYYKKVAAVADRLYLFDGRSVDIYSTTTGFAPHFIASIRPPGIVDFAVWSTAVFTLTSGGGIASFTRDGIASKTATLNEGTNVQSLGVATAADALWVSIGRNCLGGACEKKTIVYDATTLVRSTSLDGATVDVATAGTRAYAITDLPSEVRVYDVSSPLHPALIVSTPSSGAPTPVSVAIANTAVYALGDQLYTYGANDLAPSSPAFSAYQTAPGVTFTDQRIRIDGGCALVSGRSFSPQLFTVGQWQSATNTDAPSAVRSMAIANGRVYLLTDHSLEVWAAGPATPLVRHRAK